jgi:parvulin-like peptidyl-prolyl isomerase
VIRIKGKKSGQKSSKAKLNSTSPESVSVAPADDEVQADQKTEPEKKPRASKKQMDDLPELLKHGEAVKSFDQPKRRRRWLRVVLGVLGIGIIAIVGCAVAAYGFGWRGSIAMEVYRVLPFPAAVVDTKIVTLYQYYDYLDASAHYNQSEEGRNALFAFEEGELEHITLDRLIDHALTSLVLTEAGVTVSDAQLNEVIQQMEAESDEEEIEKRVQRLWGWDLEEFKKNILRPDVEKLELQKYLSTNETLFKDTQEKAESVHSAIEKKEISFEEAVEQYSEDEGSNARGGDLGLITSSSVPEEFWNAMSETEEETLTPVFRLDDGFHLVEVLQKRKAAGDGDEEEEEVIHARQILWKTPTAQEWVEQERTTRTVWMLVKLPALASSVSP